MGDGVWKIPDDLRQRAQQHDAQRTAGPVIELRSHLPIERQVRAIGATGLDRNLVVDGGARGMGVRNKIVPLVREASVEEPSIERN